MVTLIQSETYRFFGDQLPLLEHAPKTEDYANRGLQEAVRKAKESRIRHQRLRLGAAVLATVMAAGYFTGIGRSGEADATKIAQPTPIANTSEAQIVQLVPGQDTQTGVESQLPNYLLKPQQGQIIDSFTGLRPDQRDFLRHAVGGINALFEKQPNLKVNKAGMLAQAIWESGWGANADGGNYLGIKKGGWQGESHVSMTSEFKDGSYTREPLSFRTYESLEQSFEDYANLITTESHYADAAANAGDWRAYLYGLQHEPNEAEILANDPDAKILRYATAPDYVEKLSQLIEEFRLVELTT